MSPAVILAADSWLMYRSSMKKGIAKSPNIMTIGVLFTPICPTEPNIRILSMTKTVHVPDMAAKIVQFGRRISTRDRITAYTDQHRDHQNKSAKDVD